MKFASVFIVAFVLSFGAAAAAPPATPMPGTPSSLIPVKHPPYNALCIATFTPSPTTYEITDLNAKYVCSSPLLTDDGCNKQAGFSPWFNANTGTVASNPTRFVYSCFKFQEGSIGRWNPTCGNMTGFTAGPYDTSDHTYVCTSSTVTCTSPVVLDTTAFSFPAQGPRYFKYTCKRGT